MPFEKRTVMEQKREFVRLAEQGQISFSELCRRYEISRPTGYKWLTRYQQLGLDGLLENSRKPKNSPNITDIEISNRLLALKKINEDWGAKKIRRLYSDKYQGSIPSVTTVHNIFKRNGLVSNKKTSSGAKWNRFEYDYPNELGQMDYKGDFLMSNGKRCYPLTIADDHSRYNICLQACSNQKGETVKSKLSKVFMKYGLPETILADNGSPWGNSGLYGTFKVKRITQFEKWLLGQGVNLIHGRPYHPQTQGKLERYHRTLKKEVLSKTIFRNLENCQLSFNEWRIRYNEVRPHEALNLDTPISKYQPSERSYKTHPEAYQYHELAEMRKVCYRGFIKYRNQKIRVGKALIGDHVAIEPYSKISFAIFYRKKMLAEINYDSVNDVS